LICGKSWVWGASRDARSSSVQFPVIAIASNFMAGLSERARSPDCLARGQVVGWARWKTATFLAALRNDRIEAPCQLALLTPSALPPGQGRGIRIGKSFSHFDGESRLFQR
jgi:hypothetical protein